MLKNILFIAVWLWTTGCIFGQKVFISGIVSDERTKEPLIAAMVQVGNQKILTDEVGKYQLELAQAGSYPVIVSFVGYNSYQIEKVLEAGNSIFNILLRESNHILNTATVTAGKFEKPLSEVTVSLDVIKPTLLENTNTKKIDDVLQKVPGVQIIDGQANIRGGSGYSYGAGSRVLLLMDDIPMLQSDAGFPNWKDIPVENIEQIEVVKGAASALYGSSAMNGIINVRTGFARAEPETHLSTFYTYYMSPKDPTKKWWTNAPYDAGGSVLHKQKFGKSEVVGSVYYFNQSSFWKDNYEKYGRGTLNYRYRMTDNLSLGVNANFNKGANQNFFYWKNGSADAYVGAASTYSESKKTRYNIDPYLNYLDKQGNRHKILMRYYNVNNDISGADKQNASQLYYGEYQFQKKYTDWDLVTTAGFVGTATNVQAKLYGDATYTSNNAAVYVQMDKKWFERLNISVGFRYERNTQSSPEIIPITATINDTIVGGKVKDAKPVFRIGANYKVADYTFLRASWGQGYRYPTVAEKFINTNAGFPIIPNPKLTPETGWSAELGIKQGFKIADFQGFIDIVAFQSEYENMIEFGLSSSGIFAFQARNVGGTIIKGIEASVNGQGKIGDVNVSILSGYTYIDPQFKIFSQQLTGSSDTTNVLKYRFKHNFKTDIEATWGQFSIGTAVNYNSNMDAIDGIFELFIQGLRAYRQQNNKGFTVLDLRLAYRPTEKSKISLLCNNLLNEEYMYRPALLEAPRHIGLRFDYRF
ncbi:MAG: hypothetical protein RLZZ628_260 [Bacteroidota bacterium]|jgi:iron complex outermembrane receptor protein